MGASQNIISNLSKDKYTLKAQSTTTISFMGASPNYYRITNGGATPLYLGVSMMPTEDFFDMRISAATTKLYVDAYGHDEIYIYNPSVSDANIIITSFTANFDSTVLALSDIGQDFSQIDFSGSVDASGDLKTILTAIKNNSNTDSDNIERIIKQLNETWDTEKGTSTIRTILNDMYGHTKTIKNAIDNNNDVSTFGNVISQLGSINETLSSLKPVPCTKWYSGVNTDAENMYTMKYIKTISNDGESDMKVMISSTGNITLKPGEVLSDITLDATRTITIPKNSTYRLIGG